VYNIPWQLSCAEDGGGAASREYGASGFVLWQENLRCGGGCVIWCGICDVVGGKCDVVGNAEVGDE
jgi:hypothetical protein